MEHYSDLAEEVARFYGYNEIPTTSDAGRHHPGRLHRAPEAGARLGAVCRALGYDEIITYSFISPSYYDKIRMPKDSPCGTA